jgi:hypothetical protein
MDVFPTTDSSETIALCLENEAIRKGVQVKTSTGVSKIHPKEETGFVLDLLDGTSLEVEAVLVYRREPQRRRLSLAGRFGLEYSFSITFFIYFQYSRGFLRSLRRECAQC